MYDIEKVREEFTIACEDAGIEVVHPITINKRLTATLGRVMSVSNCGYVTADRIEFSDSFLKNADNETIHQTILHEAAHYIVIQRTHEKHGHDALFKATCTEIGCWDSGMYSATYDSDAHVAKKDKYSVYCPNCGRIGGYSRMCKTLQHLSLCTCKKCGSNKLKYTTNY